MFYARKRRMLSILLVAITSSIVILVLVSQYLNEKNYNHKLMDTLMDKKNNSYASPLTDSLPTAEGEPILHKTHLISQTRCLHKIFLLNMVISSPYNFEKRSAIRKTWASGSSVDDEWKTVFLVSQGNGDRLQNEQLEAEERLHGDLIRGSQKEHYRNLTLKTQMGLEWASKYCDFQFLVKSDDDVFVHRYNLIAFLKKPDTPKTKLYTGRCPQQGTPRRGGKYGVSWEEYNETRYPPFCAGPAYVLSSDLVPKLVDLFDVKAPLPLEDVYIGTLLDKIGGVKAVTHPWFRLIEFGPCRYHSDIFAYHKVKNEICRIELFNLAMKERLQATQRPRVIMSGKNDTEP
ncbi:beta-1,3-galactosyltransferase 5-like [Montipora capricornis]|uniref:beta-1,3-galactosyltransferase 5-like n=1 Tax=Montipora capricornis TaxID=246305 RepID=UPI0035F1E9F3